MASFDKWTIFEWQILLASFFSINKNSTESNLCCDSLERMKELSGTYGISEHHLRYVRFASITFQIYIYIHICIRRLHTQIIILICHYAEETIQTKKFDSNCFRELLINWLCLCTAIPHSSVWIIQNANSGGGGDSIDRIDSMGKYVRIYWRSITMPYWIIIYYVA